MSVVLIGNGPSATKKEMGERIDEFSVVVRFNNYQLRDYTKFLGTKTTVWAVNQSIRDTIPRLKRRSCDNFETFLISPDYQRRGWKKIGMNQNRVYPYCEQYGKPINQIPIEIAREATKLANAGHRNCTTGVQVLIYYLKSHECVHLHGFDLIHGDKVSPKHYYGGGSNIKRTHNCVGEGKLLQDLIEQGKVKLL